jgi:hypothetical protein
MIGIKAKVKQQLESSSSSSSSAPSTSSKKIHVERDLAKLEIYEYMKKRFISDNEFEVVLSPDGFNSFLFYSYFFIIDGYWKGGNFIFKISYPDVIIFLFYIFLIFFFFSLIFFIYNNNNIP